MKHIIIEGPDGAGKTTLARLVARVAGMAYHHEGPPPAGANVKEHYLRLVTRNEPTVFDRFHLGELVYGPILRGASALDGEDMRLLGNVVGVRARVVVCMPPYAVAHRNWLRRAVNGGELFDRQELYDKAWDAWQAVASAHSDELFDYTQEAL